MQLSETNTLAYLGWATMGWKKVWFPQL